VDREAARGRIVRRRRRILGADVLHEVDPLQKLHREEPLPARLDQLAETDEVRVLDILERPKLLFE
jgi:hypothetical protein